MTTEPNTNHAAQFRQGACAQRLLLALVLGLTADSAGAQAPKWMLPIGASISPQVDQTYLEQASPAPASRAVRVHPTRMPIPAASSNSLRLDAPELSESIPDEPTVPSISEEALPTAQLLAPQITEIAIDHSIPTTTFDTVAFDRSVDASLASSRFPLSSCRPLTQCPPAANLSCDPCADSGPYHDDFSPTPMAQSSMMHDPCREQWVYDFKRDVPTQHPWVEWGRIFYGNGTTPRGINCFGEKNMVRPQFYVYGDFRSGIATGRNANGRTDNWANRLNLDMDLRITDTERFHAFVGPIDKGAQATRWEWAENDLRYRQEMDLTPVTGYFEGDLGVFLGAAHNRTSPFELPVTIGLVPLLFQNGIWMEDAVTGAAVALPARHSRLLNWSNYDATFFAVVDQLNSPAFGGNDHAAQAFGTAWFIEAYRGYIETGYAYVRDRNVSARSYHNVTASYTRRYFDRVSNSVRIIVNAGQDLPEASRTADGALLLVENSWITAAPLRLVPYANFFVGWDRPQSVARAGVSGGILRNTGINFDTDGLNGFATLDPTASDTAGGSIGVDLLGQELDHQLLLEMSYLTPHGSKNPNVPDDQYALGGRYQVAITNHTLVRFDTMYGWRRNLENVYGTRMEYRWKF